MVWPLWCARAMLCAGEGINGRQPMGTAVSGIEHGVPGAAFCLLAHDAFWYDGNGGT